MIMSSNKILADRGKNREALLEYRAKEIMNEVKENGEVFGDFVFDEGPKRTKVSINESIGRINQVHKQRLGFVGQNLGMFLILVFAFALLPLYCFLVCFNVVYFWIRKQDKIDSKQYFKHDRHKIPHLKFADKVWCEYCEWSNGSLQWALAITNEIERRYCPIKNKESLSDDVVSKEWREEFLDYDHASAEIDLYYQKKYLPSLLDEESIKKNNFNERRK